MSFWSTMETIGTVVFPVPFLANKVIAVAAKNTAKKAKGGSDSSSSPGPPPTAPPAPTGGGVPVGDTFGNAMGLSPGGGAFGLDTAQFIMLGGAALVVVLLLTGGKK